MSKTEATVTLEDSPAHKLGIDTISPKQFWEQIEALASEKLALCVVGPSGIGKTAIPEQVAKTRGAPYMALHMPTMTPEDFHIPTTAKDTKQYFDRRIPRRFEAVIAYVETEKKKYPDGKLPPNKRPIIAIEELNRATDKSVTRGAFVLLGDRMIGDTMLDENYQFVVTMNPTGGGMAVNEFERDPAMRRRLLLMYMGASYSDFMEFADKAGFHSEVISYLRAHPSAFYDELSAKAGKVFGCPATWESVSRIAKAYEARGVPLFSNQARAAYSGAIGVGVAETFVEFVRDRSVTITPDDILSSYTERSENRKRMKSMLTTEGGRLDRVTDLVAGLSVRVFSVTDKDPAKLAKPLGLFMSDLPEEVMLSFIQHLAAEANKGGQDARLWLQKLTTALNKETSYETAIKKFHTAKEKGKAEADASGVSAA